MALGNIWFGLVLDFVYVILLYRIYFFLQCLVISFLNLFLAVLGLPCYTDFSLAATSRLLIAVPSHCGSFSCCEHRL